MPAQTYVKNINAFYEGSEQFFAHTITNVVSLPANLAAGVNFGRAVKLNGGNGVEVGSPAFVFGIALRQLTKEASSRPATQAGVLSYAQYDTVPVMKHGYVAVKLVDAGAAVIGAAPFVNATTGVFSQATVGGDAAATNVKFATGGTGFAVVFISTSVLG